MDKSVTSRNFLLLYNFFTPNTRQTIDDIFYTALKILHFRYKRKKTIFEEKRKRNKKPSREFYPLKRSDVSNVLHLTDHYLSNIYTIPPESQPLCNFGSFPLGDALRYYQNFVEGKINDIYGQEIVIDEDGLTFLFEDHDKNLSPDKYKEWRGKRLPWIRATLKNTKGIYEHTEDLWTSYYYVSKFHVPYTNEETGAKETKVNHFFIVIRKRSGKPLQFVTAYHFETEMDFLRYLEPAHPYAYIPCGER